MKKQQQDAQQIETTLSDADLAHVIGGATGPVLGPPQGPVFPGVTFDYEKDPNKPINIR